MKTVLSLEGISKSFPGVKALDNVTLEIEEGEVHALLGENGAGKSTLMKILAGLYQADDGQILLNGEKVHFNSAIDAISHGISMVHQELMPVLDRNVAENVFLGRESTFYKTTIVNKKRMNNDTKKLFDQMDIQIKPNIKMKNLSIAEIQLVEIAKAISFNSKIIIMDEPTSALSDREIKKLFDQINRLKSKGVSIIYISHRLEEIFQIADRITVLRDGKLINTENVNNISKESLISMMVGRELKDIFPKNKLVKSDIVNKVKGGPVLEIEHFSNGSLFNNVSFSLNRGEILGISGLMGAGRTELVETIFGLRKGGKGVIKKNGVTIRIHNPEQAIKHGIALVPEDRKMIGLNLQASTKDNISLITLDKYCKFNIILRNKEAKACEEIIKLLHIKTPSQKQKVSNLSGGNQQKIVIGKWLLSECEVIIMDEPTRGIDVGAKSEIYGIIRDLASKGKAIIIISSEMPEIIGMCDRVLVMCEGRLTGEIQKQDLSQEVIMKYASGIC